MAALTALQGLTAERLTAMTSIPIEETRKVMSAVHRRRHEFAPPGPIDGAKNHLWHRALGLPLNTAALRHFPLTHRRRCAPC